MMRFCFLLLLFIARPAFAVGGGCEPEMLSPVELSLPFGLPPLYGSNARGPLPHIKGLHLDGRRVTRGGLEIGVLGKNLRGRFVLLQPMGEIPVAGEIQAALATLGLATPVYGITRIRNENYYVRPLVAGPAPLADFAAGQSKFMDVLDFENIARELSVRHPGYVNWGIIPSHDWRDRPSDADFANEQLSEAFASALRDFLAQVQFVRTSDGLKLESLPELVTSSTTYRIVRAPEDGNWRFARFNWYRYILTAHLAEDEKPAFTAWMKDRSRVEWLMRTQFLGALIRRSPDLGARTVRFTGTPFELIDDAEHPFARPNVLKFKDRAALKAHYFKHATEVGALSPEDYLARARDFVFSAAEHLYFVRKNGDIVLTERSASTMAVFSPEGRLRTFMRPSVEVHRLSSNPYYFYEQILKDEGFLE